VRDARELIFLQEKGASYAPLQTQYGRLAVVDGRVVFSSTEQGPRLSSVIASIERLTALQTRAARSPSDADQAYIEALRSGDVEVRSWALETADQHVEVPSPALINAFLAQWQTDALDVADAIMTWRARGAASVVAETLTASKDGNERAAAAMALGGAGEVSYLPLLRRVASTDMDPMTRALAYRGIVWMIGPDALADLRLGARDPHEKVRAQVVTDAYNMLELESDERRFPPASSALVSEVEAFLAEMQKDPARDVSLSAKVLLANLARHRQ
jgi:HEAT repeat protein